MRRPAKSFLVAIGSAALSVGLSVGLSSAYGSTPGTTFCNGLPVTMLGTNQHDNLNATLFGRVDVVDAKAGADSVFVDAGDTACLGTGDDEADLVQDSSPGTTTLLGEEGDDHITSTATGEGDPALVEGGKGDDFIQYVWGTLKGGPGRDELIGSDFSDNLHGNALGDLLIGDYTWYIGDHGSNTGGDDNLQGGGGDDQLYGGGGDDVLEGDNGHDIANGGPGSDVCHAEVEIDCERN
jgi:Ca2+-binding RTX toxin-like protein